MTSPLRDLCPFDESPFQPCPIPKNVTQPELIQTCWPGNFGEQCGQYLAQNILSNSVNIDTFVHPLDESHGRYDAFFTVNADPEDIDGHAPRSVRIALEYVEFPLRKLRPQPEDESMWVLHDDLVLSLLDNGRVEAANWYYNEGLNIAKRRAPNQDIWWRFESTVGYTSPHFNEDGMHTTEYLGHIWSNGEGEPLENSIAPAMRIAYLLHKTRSEGRSIGDLTEAEIQHNIY